MIILTKTNLFIKRKELLGLLEIKVIYMNMSRFNKNLGMGFPTIEPSD